MGERVQELEKTLAQVLNELANHRKEISELKLKVENFDDILYSNKKRINDVEDKINIQRRDRIHDISAARYRPPFMM